MRAQNNAQVEAPSTESQKRSGNDVQSLWVESIHLPELQHLQQQIPERYISKLCYQPLLVPITALP